MSRTCIVLPSYEWGAGGVRGGLLGANVAVGYLHVLPSHCCATLGRTRGENMTSTSDASGAIDSPMPAETSSILISETAA
jgi:hypothetical protein